MILIININVNNDKNIRNCNVVAIYCVVIGYVHIVFVLFEHRRCMHKSLRKKSPVISKICFAFYKHV